ncbi:hypothetical protein [Carnobacterium maltaromaticum]|uniref:hypothetical protein n=1 Tax=Carnobacterium maltaromaticum TaxID=2751 RepID=UPI0005552F11|nr:hypothetical protein [Carnobacterium maltaromaticum]KRN62741.1 hypothetical protein IV70_GL003448 [Carnobacterium maltaromaticum DSM 20342]
MKRLMTEEQETEFVALVIAEVKSKRMTITNIKEAMEEVYQHIENNATLEKSCHLTDNFL